MDLLTRVDLQELARRERDVVHVSLFMLTHRFGDGVEADQIRWKNTLTAVESVLVDGGMRRPDVDDLLAPARALERDRIRWQYMSDGLAMFLRPGQERTFRVPVDVPEVTTIGGRFVVGPLLRILTGDTHFLLLAVSQRRLRLLEGSRHRVEQVMLPDVPTGLREVVAPPEPRSDTMAFATSPAGRGGPAVFYGHGADDKDFKRDEVERFLRQVAGGLDSYLAGEDLPQVLIGLDPLVAMYRDISNYRHIMDDAVRTPTSSPLRNCTPPLGRWSPGGCAKTSSTRSSGSRSCTARAALPPIPTRSRTRPPKAGSTPCSSPRVRRAGKLPRPSHRPSSASAPMTDMCGASCWTRPPSTR